MERVSNIVEHDDEDGSISDKSSSAASSTSSKELILKSSVAELSLYNDLLLDLTPALNNPAGNDPSIELREGIEVIDTPARPFVLSILRNFPSLNNNLATRLGEANFQRVKRLSEIVERRSNQVTGLQADSRKR